MTDEQQQLIRALVQELPVTSIEGARARFDMCAALPGPLSAGQHEELRALVHQAFAAGVRGRHAAELLDMLEELDD